MGSLSKSLVELAPRMERGYLGIDPGKTGGVGFYASTGQRYAAFSSERMTMADRMEVLRFLQPWSDGCALEEPGAWQGQAVTNYKLGRDVGRWEALLGALEIPAIAITPPKWVVAFASKAEAGKLSKVERKRLTETAVRMRATEPMHPHLAMKLATADAVALAVFAKESAYVTNFAVLA